MSSKKYRGKLCVYCGVATSTTKDHVFARELFAEGRTGYLPQVPACQPCNNEKSKLEYYLAAVLPFGGRHPDASKILEADVPRRLAKNAPLHSELSAGAMQTVIQNSSGQGESGMAIPFNGESLQRLFELIVRGLMWEHWKVVLSQQFSVRVISLSKHGEGIFLQFHRLSAGQRIGGNLGNGMFLYEGAQGKDYPELSTWAFEIYGGVHFSGDSGEPGQTTAALCAFTGKKTFLEGSAFTGLFGSPASDAI